MGSPKQLLAFKGKTLVLHAVETALQSACRPVVAVVGAAAESVLPLLEGLPVHIVHNSRWRDGMGSSIRAGIAALAGYDVDAAILSLADLPLITPQTFDRLVQIHDAGSRSIVAAEYSGTLGAPALFNRSFFPELQGLASEQGCKPVIFAHLDSVARLPCPEAAVDVDTPDDYQRLCGLDGTAQAIGQT